MSRTEFTRQTETDENCAHRFSQTNALIPTARWRISATAVCSLGTRVTHARLFLNLAQTKREQERRGKGGE